jgi:GNAT superfamily N-acetyltransferase
MAAEDHLSPTQFYGSPQGTLYHLSHEGWNTVMAHKVKPTGELSKAPVGDLTYFDTNIGASNKPDQPTVYKAVVKPAHQRRGLASAMFDFADQHAQKKYGKPLQHSTALSDEGKAFVEGHLRKRGGQ